MIKPLLASVLLLLGAGALHRWAYASRIAISSSYRVPAIPLSRFPAEIGPYYLLRDVPVDDDVLRTARVDDSVSRLYATRGDPNPVNFYIGYWGRENVGMGHGPEVCYPSTGWEAEAPPDVRKLRFSLPDGRATEATIAVHHFVRNHSLSIERRSVAFVAVIGEEFRSSSRGYFSHRPPRSGNDGFMAHIQVATAAGYDTWDAADTRVWTFMEAALPHVAECLFEPGADSGDESQPDIGTWQNDGAD